MISAESSNASALRSRGFCGRARKGPFLPPDSFPAVWGQAREPGLSAIHTLRHFPLGGGLCSDRAQGVEIQRPLEMQGGFRG